MYAQLMTAVRPTTQPQAVAEFSKQFPSLVGPLMDERDRFLASRLHFHALKMKVFDNRESTHRRMQSVCFWGGIGAPLHCNHVIF